MKKIVGKVVLGFFVGWLALGASFVPVFLLPQPAHYASAIPVEVASDPFTVFLTSITDALGTVGNKLSEITSTVQKWLQTHTLIAEALKAAWQFARKALLNMLVNDVVAWIQGGGTPRFVTDFPGTLESVADQALGEFGSTLANVNLCSDFRPAINILIPPTRPFFEARVACTASQITANMERIWESGFGEGGAGWQNWLKIQEPQNNVFGAYFLAQGELADRLARQTEAQKLQISAGQGFLGPDECEEWAVMTQNTTTGIPQPSGQIMRKDQRGDISVPGAIECKEETVTVSVPQGGDFAFQVTPDQRGAAGSTQKVITCKKINPNDGRIIDTTFSEAGVGTSLKCQKKRVLTPGSVVARAASKYAVDSDFEWLVNADEVGEFLAAIVDAIINRVAREGLAYVRHEAGSQTTASLVPGPQGVPVPFVLTPLSFCDGILDPVAQDQCRASSGEISSLASDPIQIVMVDRPLMPQLQTDLESFAGELAGVRQDYQTLRGVQGQAEAAERRIAEKAASIQAAPREPDPALASRDLATFPTVPPPPLPPPQCTLGSFALSQTRTFAQQSGNSIAEIFLIAIQGVPQVASLNPVNTIGNITVNKTMTFTDTDPNPSCPAVTRQRWNSSFEPLTNHNIDLDIETSIAETQAKIDAIDSQLAALGRLVGDPANGTDGTVDKYRVGGPDPANPSRTHHGHDYWYEALGIASGVITADQTLRAQALDELTKLRTPIIKDLQTLMASTEPEISDLIIQFVNFRSIKLIETAGIDITIGSASFPEVGGYYGLIKNLEALDGAVANELAECVRPIVLDQACPSSP